MNVLSKHQFGMKIISFCSFFSCLCLVVLLFAVFVPVYNITDTANATAGTPTASTLTFTSTNPVASVSLAMGSPTGTFATSSSSEKAAFSISTNNYTGYTLTMTSTGSNTTLTDGSSHNISTISSSTTAAVFSADSAAGQALNNRWGYIPSYYNSAANTTTYYPAPTSVNAATLRTTSSANSSNGVDNADDYTIGLGFRADYNSPSGTYANDTFILNFVANTIAYTITYDKNSTDTVTNMPANQSSDASATNIALSNLVPVRTGYSFLGWCFGTVTTANGFDTCSGNVYNPNGGGTDLTFGIDQTSTNSPTLYAMWEATYTLTFKTTGNATNIVFNGETFTNNQTKTIKASELTNPYHIYGNYATRYAFSSWSTTAGTFENQNYQNTAFTVTGDATITLTGRYVNTAMQNLSVSNCSTTAMPVYDNRDSSVYWVQKLADGNCWMLDNLALDLTSSTVVNSLSTSNTNLDSTALTKFKNGSGTTSDRYPTTAYGTFGSTNSYSQPLTNMGSKNITLRPSTATNYTGSFTGAYGLGQGKIGAYYNYCAASVGYYCFGDGTSEGTSSGDNAYDVCPAGWRMPTGNTSGEYKTLYTNASINSDATTYRNTLSTPLSGHFYSGSANLRGSYGRFWSSTRNSNSGMYYLNVNSSNVNPTDADYRFRGFSVRCIVTPSLTITVDSGVTDVTLKMGSTSGATVTGTKSGNTITFKNLVQGINYYLFPTFATDYFFYSWAKTDSATGSALGSTSTENTYYTVGSGAGTLSLTSKPLCDGNKICYFPSSDSVEDTMSDQSVSSTDTSTMLWPSNFKRPGYGFAGWTDKEDWVLGANDASGNGTGANAGYHIYGPMQTIEFTAGQYSTAGLPLYAVWVPSAGSIQNWAGCSSLAQGAVTALTDQRDNNTYAVAKLADGKCWMIENLRLDNTNSDNATGTLSQGYGGQFIGLANPETANFTGNNGAFATATDPTEPNSIYYAGTLVAPATVNITQTNYASFRMPRFRNDNTNTNTTLNPNTTVANMTGTNQNIYSYGNWYSWPAAIANTDYLANLTDSNAANTSICPKGWRLPKGGDKANESANEFWLLVVTGLNNGTNPANYSSSAAPYYNYAEEAGPVNKKLRTFPNNFVYSGFVNNSSVFNRGSYGYYWSATSRAFSNAYELNFYSTYVNPGTNINSKCYGISVRCVVGSGS